MSDRRLTLPSRALAQRYADLVGATRITYRRAAWPSPTLLDEKPGMPLASTPAPSYIPSFPSYDTVGSATSVASLALPPGRWFVVARSSQRFTRSSGIPVAVAGHFLLVDGVVERNAQAFDGFYSEETQMPFSSSITLNTKNGATLELRVFCGWDWVAAPDPAPTQSLRAASIIAYPG